MRREVPRAEAALTHLLRGPARRKELPKPSVPSHPCGMGSLGFAAVASLLLILVNAFFVASEFAMVKVRPTTLELRARSGGKRARSALVITHKLDAFLSANQLGITLASLALGWVGEPLAEAFFVPLVSGRGLSAETAEKIAAGIGFAALTFAHVVLGELAPKSVAIQRTELVALWTAIPLRVFYGVAFPVIWLFNASANLALRLVGMHTASEADVLHSPEEVRLLLRRLEMQPGTRNVMDRLFDYTHRVARQVMTLRADVVTLDEDASFETSVRTALENQFSRYPVVDHHTDRVTGYVHFKDIAQALLDDPRPSTLAPLVREPLFVHEDMPLDELRREFLRRRVHLAIVQDDRDTFRGIVTLEDLLEEFVGEIRDEQDEGELAPVAKTMEGSFEVDGRVTLDVLARETGLVLVDEGQGVETIGGVVRARTRERLRPGSTVSLEGYRIVVLAVRDGRPQRLRVIPPAPVAASRPRA